MVRTSDGKVTLHVRVWIEIDTKSMISLLVMVTLHVRVWIEIPAVII